MQVPQARPGTRCGSLGVFMRKADSGSRRSAKVVAPSHGFGLRCAPVSRFRSSQANPPRNRANFGFAARVEMGEERLRVRVFAALALLITLASARAEPITIAIVPTLPAGSPPIGA